MNNSLTSTAANNQNETAVTRKSSSTTGLSGLSLNLLIRYIDNVLSALNNQGLGCKIIDSGMELRDLVQPVASDFSKLFDGISEGAKMFTDQKFLKSQLSTEAHSVAVDVLKGLGNAHWVAVGLLAIANVLERFDNISANDRECIDLLIAMLKLGKYLKQMKDINADLHKESLEDMREAVKLIISGAILCCSFITSNKLSKFILTKKIRDELVYVRGKVDSMKADLILQMQVLTVKTFTFYHEQNNDTGGQEENNGLGGTEQNPSQQSKDAESDNEECCETELEGSGSDTVSSQAQDNYNGVNEPEQLEMPPRRSLGVGKFLRKKIPNIFKRQSQKPELFVEEIQEIQNYKSLINFKREELDKATANYSLQIGSGAFGTVYRGILSDGREVAVKILKIEARQGEKEWMNNLKTLTKLRHRNIVEVVGCCHEDMMLVYDYFPRNLSSAIFETEIILNWSIRLRIILDVIRGLAYLHEGTHFCIVHRDIKPNNVVLDENFNAKICDFGLARILEPDCAQYANIAETLGYLDPGHDVAGLSAKSDIYSFGLMLLNVVSGKRVIELTNELLLSEHAWRLCEEDWLHELIDPRLLNTDCLIYSSSISRTIITALWCIHKEPKRRPSASRVLAMLLSEEEMRIPLQGVESYLDFGWNQAPVLSGECLESSHATVLSGESLNSSYVRSESFHTDMLSGESCEY
ncbi:receptor-like cytosolic serine/threonine-protein kinase RBK1 isoform X2 [Cryptomeria japonica]|uniref:receptor-like cytosolic serine/threonine-protein kinase RBK1 isoform X2 n=1 Tax=Cryptomeria japonica TaxID=3369 RepID=UPI0027DA01DF|nr:receptor-like cytosolic serine/threonine-protein kinase RBK1 isoform X2 [Cryptomeria japonica]